MSRVGKNPVAVPQGVEVKVDGMTVRAKGKKGEQVATFKGDITLALEGTQVWVKPTNGSKQARMMWGTARNTIKNMVHGVNEGFKTELEINTLHHQAIDRLGRGLKVVAAAPDGVTEAIEWSQKDHMPFLLGTQWHPERRAGSDLSTHIGELFLKDVQRYVHEAPLYHETHIAESKG